MEKLHSLAEAQQFVRQMHAEQLAFEQALVKEVEVIASREEQLEQRMLADQARSMAVSARKQQAKDFEAEMRTLRDVAARCQMKAKVYTDQLNALGRPQCQCPARCSCGPTAVTIGAQRQQPSAAFP